MNIHEETLKIARNLIKKDPSLTDWVISKFPELQTSEDEKIRKELMQNLKERFGTRGSMGGNLDMPRVLSWLEKQGEKPANNVETKFKVGDWFVQNERKNNVKVVNATPLVYKVVDILGYHHTITDTAIENNYHLWTINDANDGDVLVSESQCGSGTWYCIFKSLDDDESMTVYCYLARDGRFETKKELCFDKDPYNTKPATKEQRDLLFKKMHEAGYTFDFEKKELKKIEQKKTPIEGEFPYDNPSDTLEGEIENIWRKLSSGGRFSATRDGFREVITHFVNYIKEQDDRELVEQKSSWSEKDEQKFIQAVEALEDFGKFELADWLKEYKNQFLKPQNT